MGTLALLARAHKAGQNIGALSDAMYERKPEKSVRRIQRVLNLAKKYGVAACEDACAAALELRVPSIASGGATWSAIRRRR